MAKGDNYHLDFDGAGMGPEREDYENEDIKSSFFRGAYQGLRDFFHLLRHPVVNSSKVVNYDLVFEEKEGLVEENEGLRQSEVDLVRRLGESKEEKRKIVGDLGDLAHDCKAKDGRIESLYNLVCELVDDKEQQDLIMYEIINQETDSFPYKELSELKNLCGLQKKVIAGSNRKIKKLEKKVDEKQSLLIKSYDGLKKLFYSEKRDKKRQNEISKIKLKLWNKKIFDFNELNKIEEDEGIKGLRKIYWEYFERVKEKRKEKQDSRKKEKGLEKEK